MPKVAAISKTFSLSATTFLMSLPPTNRFSPGYGDYPLEKQREVVKILNTEKKLGLSLTDSLLLNPTKSVTAVIGLNKNEVKGKINCTSKCMKCGNKNCPYRREN